MTINQESRRDTVAVAIDQSEHNSFHPPEREEYIFITPKSRSTHEKDSSLQFSNHFHDVNGFILKYNHKRSPDISCPPKITIIPGNHIPHTKSSWTFRSSGKRRMMDLKQDGQEVLSFTYQFERQVFGRAERRVAHIFLHRQNESCGKVECTEAGLKSTIIDYTSESTFTLSQISMSPTPKIEIQDIFGNVVGIGIGLRGIRNLRRDITWTELKFTYLPSTVNLPASEKAVLAVGFFMWVFIYNEKKTRERRITTCITLFFLSLFVGLPLAVMSLLALYIWIRSLFD